MKLSTSALALRVISALAVALFVACLLSFGRGGFDTGPFIVFAVTTFVGAIGWQLLFRRETLSFVERGLRHLPHHMIVRYALTFVALVCLTIWWARIGATWGFAAWLLGLFADLLVPAIICPLVPRFPILFGIVAEGCMLLSDMVACSTLYSKSREIQWSHVLDHPDDRLIAWGIASALSLIFSIPVYLSRRGACKLSAPHAR